MGRFFFKDADEVAGLFDRNASYYDRVNTVICLGQDALWRRWAARRALEAARGVSPRRPKILDACGGTGLVAEALACRGADVTLVDHSRGMLAVAHERFVRDGLRVETAQVDLDRDDVVVPGAPFDAVTVAFGLRYFRDPVALLRRLAAALAPGGSIVILESVVPPRALLSQAAGAYYFKVAPRMGALLARRRELYDQLTATTRDFGTAERLVAAIEAAGLRPIAGRLFVFGVVVGVVARPAPPGPSDQAHAGASSIVGEASSGRVEPPA